MHLRTLFTLSALVAGLSAGEVAMVPILTRGQQEQALAKVVELVREEYVFPELAARAAEALGKRTPALVSDAPAEASAFIARINAELRELTHDKHVSVRKVIPNFDKPVG